MGLRNILNVYFFCVLIIHTHGRNTWDEDTIKKLNSRVNELKKWNYEDLISYSVKSKRFEMENDVLKVIKLVEAKNYNQIDQDLKYRFTRAYREIKMINKYIKNDFVYNEKSDTWTKTTIEELPVSDKESIAIAESRIKNLIEWNYEVLLKYLDRVHRESTRSDIKKMKSLLERKKYSEITISFKSTFSKIYQIFKDINYYITNGYEYDKETNSWRKTFTQKSESIDGEKKLKLEDMVGQLKEWKYENLLRYIERSNKEQIRNDVINIITWVENKKYDEINDSSYKWFKEMFKVFKKINSFILDGYTYNESIDTWEKSIKERKPTLNDVSLIILKKRVQQLKDWNYANLFQYVDENQRNKIQTDVSRMITLIDNKQYGEIDVYFNDWFKQIFEVFKMINFYITDGYTYNKEKNLWEKKNIQKIVPIDDTSRIELEQKVQQLKNWKYMTLIQYVDKTNREQVRTDLTKIVKFVENKEFVKIDIHFYNWFNQIYEFLKKINSFISDGYKYNENSNVWEKGTMTKNVPINEMLKINLKKQVKQLKDWNYLNLLKYVAQDNKEQIQNDVLKMINLVESKKFNEIDISLNNWFNRIFEMFRNINFFIVDGYTYNDSTKIWEKMVYEKKIPISRSTLIRLESQIKLLKEWNYLNLLKYVDANNKERIQSDISRMIMLVENKREGDIDEDFENWFTQIFEMLKTINYYVRNGYIYNDEKNIFEKKIIKSVDIKDTNFISTLDSRVKQMKEWKYKDLLKYVDKNLRNQLESDILKMIKLVEDKKYNEIDMEYNRWFTEIFDMFKAINYYIVNGYKFNQETEIWSKEITSRKVTMDNVAIKEFEDKVQQLKDWNYVNLLKYVGANKVDQIHANILKMIDVAETKSYSKIDANLKDSFLQIFNMLSKINYYITNSYTFDEKTQVWKKWNIYTKAPIDNNLVESLKQKVKQIKDMNFLKLLKYMNVAVKKEIKTDILKIMKLVDEEKYNEIDIQFYNWFSQIFQQFIRINYYITNGFIYNDKKNTWEKTIVQYSTPIDQQIIVSLKEKVNTLKTLKYNDLLKYVDLTTRTQVDSDVAKMISLVEYEKYNEINTDFYYWFLQIFEMLTKINNYITDKYTYNEKTNVWEKTGVIKASAINDKEITKLETRVNILKTWDVKVLMSYVDKALRKKVEDDIAKMTKLVDNKKYGDIDVEFNNWFTQIFELLTRINHYIKKGYEYKESTNTWKAPGEFILSPIDAERIIELNKKIKLMKTWNVMSLMIYVDKTMRDKVKDDVSKMMKIVEMKKYEDIDIEFYNWFTQIFDLFTRINDYLKNGYKYDENTNIWGKSSVIKPTPIDKEEILKLENRVKIIKTWNVMSLMIYIDKTMRQKVNEDVDKMIKLVEMKQYLDINIEFNNWFTQIYEFFSRINYYLTNGYKYNEKLNIWEKNTINIKVPIDKHTCRNLDAKYKEIEDLKYVKLLKYFPIERKKKIESDIMRMKMLIKEKKYNEIDLDLNNRFNQIFEMLSRINQYIINGYMYNNNTNKWEEIKFEKQAPISKKLIASLELRVKKIKDLNYVNFLKYIDPVTRKQVESDTLKIINIVDNKKFNEVDINFYNWFLQIYQIFININSYLSNGFKYNDKLNMWEKSITERNTLISKEDFLNLEGKIQILKDWNYENLLRFTDTIKRTQIEPEIIRIINLVESKKYDEIDATGYNWFIQIFEFISRINHYITNGYTYNDKTNTFEKVTMNVVTPMSQESILKLEKEVNKLKTWNYLNLIKYIDKRNQESINNDLKKVINLVELKKYTEIDNQLMILFNEIFQIISRINFYIKNGYSYNDKSKKWEKTIEESDIIIKKELIPELKLKMKQLTDMKFVTLLKYFDATTRKQIEADVLKIVELVETKKYSEINVGFYNYFLEIFETFTKINNYITNGYVYNDKNYLWEKTVVGNVVPVDNEVIKQLEIKIKQLKDWNYKSLMNYVDKMSKSILDIHLTKIITLFDQNKFNKIDVLMKIQFDQIFDTLARINYYIKAGFRYNEKENIWEKGIAFSNIPINEDLFNKLKANVAQLIDINYKTLLIYVDQTARKQIESDTMKMISLVEDNKYKDIDNFFYAWFTKIFDMFMKINYNLIDGYTFNKYKNVWEKKPIGKKLHPEMEYILNLNNKVQQLKDWNYLNLLIYIDKTERIRIKNDVMKMIKINNDKRYGDINDNFKLQFLQIYDMFKIINDYIEEGYVFNSQTNIWEKSRITETLIDQEKIEKIKRKVQKLKNWNYLNLIKNIDKNERENTKVDIEKMINMLDTKLYKDITIQIQLRFKQRYEIIKNIKYYIEKGYKFNENTNLWEKGIKKMKAPIDEEDKNEIKKKVKKVKEWNYLKLLRYVDETNKENFKIDCLKMIKIIEKEKFDDIDLTLKTSFEMAYRTFKNIKSYIRHGYTYNERNKIWEKTNIKGSADKEQISKLERQVQKLKDMNYQNLLEYVEESNRIRFKTDCLKMIAIIENKKYGDLDLMLKMSFEMAYNMFTSINGYIKDGYTYNKGNKMWEKGNMKGSADNEEISKLERQVQQLKDWNYQNLLEYVEESNRIRFKTDCLKMIAIIENKKYGDLDLMLKMSFKMAYNMFTSINGYIKDGYTYNKGNKMWEKITN